MFYILNLVSLMCSTTLWSSNTNLSPALSPKPVRSARRKNYISRVSFIFDHFPASYLLIAALDVGKKSSIFTKLFQAPADEIRGGVSSWDSHFPPVLALYKSRHLTRMLRYCCASFTTMLSHFLPTENCPFLCSRTCSTNEVLEI